MPLQKQEAYNALKALVALRPTLPDAQSQADADRLIAVLQSKLFVALLDMQAFYHRHVLEGSSEPLSQNENPSRSFLPVDGTGAPTSATSDDGVDLEWEHQYDVGPGAVTPTVRSRSRGETPDEREEMFEVVIERPAGAGLGMSISGGIDRPYVRGDGSIYITALVPDGPAAKAGNLVVGDRIQSVNGQPFESIQHVEAVRALSAPGALHLLIVRSARGPLSVRSNSDPRNLSLRAPETHLETVELLKDANGLGFSIAGGVGAAHLAGDNSIFITKLTPGGAAERDGRLAAGDKIVAVQGQSCENVTHDEAVALLRSPVSVIQLQVEHNAFDRAAAALSRALGQQEAAYPKFTRTGTLRAFGHGELPPMEPVELQAEEPHERSVTLRRGATGFGFDMVGPPEAGPGKPGEPVGIFVSRVYHGGAADLSGEVLEGDQICSINGSNVLFASSSEARDKLVKMQGPALLLTLKANPPMWAIYKQRMTALQLDQIEERRLSIGGEVICIRALFDYNPSLDTAITPKDKRRMPSLLTVHLHDVFIFRSAGDKGDWWEVTDVTTGKQGLIPSSNRRAPAHQQVAPSEETRLAVEEFSEQAAVAQQQVSHTKKRRSFSFRFARRLSLSFRRRSRASALDVAASAEVSTATLPVPTASLASYERVELRQHRSTCMRPLVLLGPNKDIFSDQLLVEYPELFSACVPHTTRSPRAGEVNGVDYHFVSLEAMSHDIEAGKFLEVGQYKGHLYGTAFAAVRSVAERGVVCLVDASVDAIAHMHEADIQPMVIFLKPVSVQALIDQTPNMTPERATEAFAMAEKMERTYAHLFTQVISNSTSERTFQRLLETIRRESRQPFWAKLIAPLP